MNNIELPNIPDDEISPLRPDIKWFSWMMGIIFGFAAFCFLFFYGFAYFIIGNLDLEKEKKYFGEFFLDGNYKPLNLSFIDSDIEIPENIDIHILKSDEINAFATLGGNILFTTALLEELDYEEEFLFILGHEIEHIKNRDVLRGISTQIPVYITLMFLGMDVGFSYDTLFNLTSSYLSRQTELKADIGGIEFVKNIDGNTDCILNFFQDKENIFEKYLAFSSTHPTSKERIKQISMHSLGDNTDFSKCRQLNYELQ